MKWYKRCGTRVSQAAVERARQSYVDGKRTGKLGSLRCSVQPEMADAVEKMTLLEYANWSGHFTYRH